MECRTYKIKAKIIAITSLRIELDKIFFIWMNQIAESNKFNFK